MFRVRAEAKGLQFEVHVKGEPVEYLVSDEGKIRQVLINLLGNATKFTTRGRIDARMSLDYRSDRQLWLWVEVEDTGAGLTVEEQSSLFQPFVQAKSGQRVYNGGTGLGLAISRGVAELMSGSITVRSTPGSGSVFRFEIPVQAGAIADIPGQSDSRGRVLHIMAGQDAPRILVVDDIPDNREWLSGLLTSLGFSVRQADNGENAISAWKEWAPQLVLMDVQMPVMDGLEATRRIKADPLGRATSIITLTASALEEDRKAAFQSGADDFLSKPCLEGELLEKIRVLLGISYEYETSGEPELDSPKAALAISDTLVRLPMALIEALRKATLAGNKKALNQLILKVGQTEDRTAQALQQLADNYDYDTLTRLFEEVCLTRKE
jgi:CheY-like chemotaxis protein